MINVYVVDETNMNYGVEDSDTYRYDRWGWTEASLDLDDGGNGGGDRLYTGDE